MGGILFPYHQISTNLFPKTTFAKSFAHNRDGVVHSSLATIRSATRDGGKPSTPRKDDSSREPTKTEGRTSKKYSKEELIAFFRSIQIAISKSSRKTSKRRKKQAADPFEEVEQRKHSYGKVSRQQGGRAEAKFTRRTSDTADRSPTAISTATNEDNRGVSEEQPSEADADEASEGPNLSELKAAELRELARARGLRGYSKLKKDELIDLLKGPS